MVEAPSRQYRGLRAGPTSPGGGDGRGPDDGSDPWPDGRRRVTLGLALVGIVRALVKPWRYGPFVRCPRCGAQLTVQNSFGGFGYAVVHEYRCDKCDLTLMLPYYDPEETY